MKQRDSHATLGTDRREGGAVVADGAAALPASCRVAWIIAGLIVAAALFEAVALMALAPWKVVVPYTLMVDRNTGYVKLLKPLGSEGFKPDATLTQSLLVQYLIARETFDIDELRANYGKVILWSTDRAKADYVDGMQINNPSSPLARLPRTTTVSTYVKSASLLGNNVALIRFDTERRDAGGRSSPARSWVAIVQYRFSSGSLGDAERYDDPLGFQVMRYRKDQDVIQPPETRGPAATVPLPSVGAPPASAPPDSSRARIRVAPTPRAAPPRPPATPTQQPEVEL